ncbi:anti-repressor SinI family protein [Bacillus sp. MRMR6]|nr:anti-repressor SinI family protein [Bacillus sp. MRMR6]
MRISETVIEGIDAEWVALILEAKELGLSMEMVREFLHESQIRDNG